MAAEGGGDGGLALHGHEGTRPRRRRAVRLARLLAQHARVADAQGDALGVEELEQRLRVAGGRCWSSSRRVAMRDRAVALDAARPRAPATSASASRWMCMSRPRRTMRPCVAQGGERRRRRLVGRRLVAGGAQALLEREGGGRRAAAARRGAARAAGAGAGLGLRLAALEPREPGEQVAARAVPARRRGRARRRRRACPAAPASGSPAGRRARGTIGCSSRSWK